MRRRFYVAPSGRLHWMASCSGGPGPRRMIATTLTVPEWEEWSDKCRCARWTAATQAKESSSSVSQPHNDGVA